ncbi:hypothetical protein BDW22DRAFT_1423424 [Trametopsis cervina]|nr:hypothetical protein BDW22DRAFT_1423424 [Trametopsis cervina]
MTVRRTSLRERVQAGHERASQGSQLVVHNHLIDNLVVSLQFGGAMQVLRPVVKRFRANPGHVQYVETMDGVHLTYRPFAYVTELTSRTDGIKGHGDGHGAKQRVGSTGSAGGGRGKGAIRGREIGWTLKMNRKARDILPLPFFHHSLGAIENPGGVLDVLSGGNMRLSRAQSICVDWPEGRGCICRFLGWGVWRLSVRILRRKAVGVRQILCGLFAVNLRFASGSLSRRHQRHLLTLAHITRFAQKAAHAEFCVLSRITPLPATPSRLPLCSIYRFSVYIYAAGSFWCSARRSRYGLSDAIVGSHLSIWLTNGRIKPSSLGCCEAGCDPLPPMRGRLAQGIDGGGSSTAMELVGTAVYLPTVRSHGSLLLSYPRPLKNLKYGVGPINGPLRDMSRIHQQPAEEVEPLRAPERGCMRHDDVVVIVVVHSRFSALRMPSHAISHYIVVTSYYRRCRIRRQSRIGKLVDKTVETHPRTDTGATKRRLAFLKSAARSVYLAHNGDDAMPHVASKRGKTNVGWSLHSRKMAVGGVGLDVDIITPTTQTPDRSVSGWWCRQGDVPGQLMVAGDSGSHCKLRAHSVALKCPEPGLFPPYNGRGAPSIPHSQRTTFRKQRLCLRDLCNCPPLCLRPCTLPHHASSDRSWIPRTVRLIRSSTQYASEPRLKNLPRVQFLGLLPSHPKLQPLAQLHARHSGIAIAVKNVTLELNKRFCSGRSRI